MLCSRCLLPLLGIYLLLEDVCAAVLPNRNKREVSQLDQDIFQYPLDDRGHLSLGDAGELNVDVDRRYPAVSDTALNPEHVSTPGHSHQHHRKSKEKRRKVAPLDAIGSFQMSSFRNRKDELDT